MNPSHPVDPETAQTNRDVKQIEKWPLIRAIVPLMVASVSFTVLYVVFGLTTDVRTMLVGAPIIAVGFVSSLVGFRRRLREMQSGGEPNTRGYGWIFLGWACVVLGLLLPWYLVA